MAKEIKGKTKKEGSKTKKSTAKVSNEISIEDELRVLSSEQQMESKKIIEGLDSIEEAKSQFIVERCKRDRYIAAWNHMYKNNKKEINCDPLYADINPSLNKNPLGSETDNFCTVAYDQSKPCDEFTLGTPVGIFSFVVTPSKVIGKQFLVLPQYLGKGLGKAVLIENEKTLLDNGISKYYIGCSKCSAGIYKSWGLTPFFSDEVHDMYKFDVDLSDCGKFEKEYAKVITNKGIKVIK